MASKKRSCLTLSQVLDDVFASSESEELGESSNMISGDDGDVIFKWPPGCGGVLTDSESELDGESSRNSSRSASFDQDSGGSESDAADLGPGDLSDYGSHSSRQSSSPSPPPTLPTVRLDVCPMLIQSYAIFKFMTLSFLLNLDHIFSFKPSIKKIIIN